MITFTRVYTSSDNCAECKKRLGIPNTTNKCIYDFKEGIGTTYKFNYAFKDTFDISIHKGNINSLASCCSHNLIYYITPEATLHKKLLL